MLVPHVIVDHLETGVVGVKLSALSTQMLRRKLVKKKRRLRFRLHFDGSGQNVLPVEHFYNRPFHRYGGHIEFIRFKEY